MGTNQLLQRFTAPGPKRMLSLDGGGIRGLVALEYLRRIETLLRELDDEREVTAKDCATTSISLAEPARDR